MIGGFLLEWLRRRLLLRHFLTLSSMRGSVSFLAEGSRKKAPGPFAAQCYP